MGVVNNHSGLVANEEAKPIVYNHVGLNGGRVRSIVAKTAWAATGDSNNSTAILCKLHPEWRILHIWLYNDAMSSGTDYNFGLYSDVGVTPYSTAADAPTAVSESAYADAQTLAAAFTGAGATNAVGGGVIDIAYQNRDINKMGQHVYEDAGHTTANKLNAYWLGLKAIAIGGTAGDIVVNVEFTSD